MKNHPIRGSSSVILCPPLNLLNHSNTYVCNEHLLSNTSFNITFCGDFLQSNSKLKVNPFFRVTT